MIEYENYHGRPVLILYRDKGAETTHLCPFCGNEHNHAPAEGHRIAHCGGDDPNLSVFASDGTELFMKNGYIIKDI